MNWGNKIVVAFILFAAFIGYMVVKAFQEDFDLVAEDYYAKEIAYQQKLNKLSNAAEDEMQVQVQQTVDAVTFTFPKDAQGEIHFYHPSRKIFDKTFSISHGDDMKQEISKSELVAGNYRVNITWKADNTDYLQQSSIYLK